MARFRESMHVDAAPEQVFDFIADVRNLPHYLPTTKHAESQGPERVHVQGEARGHPYDAAGFLRADQERLTLEWGADDDWYSGRMEARPDAQATQLTVELTFNGEPPWSRSGAQGPSDDDIREGLRSALRSIANQVTGSGGKVEPAAATSRTAKGQGTGQPPR